MSNEINPNDPSQYYNCQEYQSDDEDYESLDHNKSTIMNGTTAATTTSNNNNKDIFQSARMSHENYTYNNEIFQTARFAEEDLFYSSRSFPTPFQQQLQNISNFLNKLFGCIPATSFTCCLPKASSSSTTASSKSNNRTKM